MLINGGMVLKKSLLLTAGITGAVLITSGLIKGLNKDAAMKGKILDENYTEERNNTEERSEVKKTQKRDEKMVNVSNSLVNITIKVFSK